jgi:hypothetical protein
MKRRFVELKIHIRCLSKMSSFPKPTRDCLLQAFKKLRDGQLEFQRLYPGVRGDGLFFSEACGFRIYLTIKADRAAVVDVALDGHRPSRTRSG